jgi:hypothetical protein
MNDLLYKHSAHYGKSALSVEKDLCCNELLSTSSDFDSTFFSEVQAQRGGHVMRMLSKSNASV